MGLHEVSPGIWVDDQGNYYDDSGNPIDPSALAAGGGGTTTTTSAGGGKIPISHVDLGDRVVTYFSDGTSSTDAKGKVASTATNNVHTTERLIDPNQLAISQQQRDTANAQLAEQARQYNETFGYNKARGDQQQQLAQGEAVGYFNGQPTLARDRLGLDQKQQAINYYKDFSDKASNPRNFMETFFHQRGFPNPAGSSDFSNMQGYGTPATAPFPAAPNRSMSAGNAQTYANPVTSQTGAQYPQGTVLSPTGNSVYGSSYQGLSGFDAATNKPRLSPNDPDAAGLMAKNPGMYAMTSASDAAKYLPQSYARGGVIPEPVVGRGVRSGQQYTFGENGPEGVVPANYLPRFLQHGGSQGSYANGGLIGQDPYSLPDPGMGDPAIPQAPAPTGPNDPSNPYSGSYNPWDVQTTQQYGPQVPTGFGPVMTPGVDYGAQGAALAAAANGANPNLNPPPPMDTTPTQPAPPQWNTITSTPQTPAVDPYAALNAQAAQNPRLPISDPRSQGIIPPPEQMAQPGQTAPGQPLGQPQSSNGFNQGITTPTPAPGTSPLSGAPAGTFGNPVSSYLPYFLSGEDNGPLSKLADQSAVPPFLQRVFAQQFGDKTLGTNQPQKLDLPKQVPVVSKLAYNQMSPSEQQALMSYVSAYGITPDDYMAFMEQMSPHGPQSTQPLFGNSFNYARQ